MQENRYVNQSLKSLVEKVVGFPLNTLQEKSIELIEKTDRNIVVVAPTGSGKTVIGLAGLLKEGKGFYLAPLISLMMEKYYEFKKILGNKYTIAVTNRDYKTPINTFLSTDIKILSPYKLLSLINSIEPKRHGKVIVVDEIHKISGDPLFEASITLAKEKGFRIIGLSATINNEDINYLKEWLSSYVVISTRRPVKLYHTNARFQIIQGFVEAKEEIVVDGMKLAENGEVFFNREQLVGILARRLYLLSKKPVIVWAPTRRRVEGIAKEIARKLPEDPKYSLIASKLPATNSTEKLLKYTVRRGVFIHHGGLSSLSRKLVEKYYKELGGIIVTAYTLSHGVNIPGNYLIISTIYDWRDRKITPSVFHQISGRAGRPGYGEYGVVITITLREEEEDYYNNVLMRETASSIKPTLLDDTFYAVKMLLPIIYYTDERTAVEMLKRSLSYLKNPDDSKVKLIVDSLLETEKYYSRFTDKERQIAYYIGLHPLEHYVLNKLLNYQYKEGIEVIAGDICRFFHLKCVNVSTQLVNYGFLSIWFGNPSAREVAGIIQNILESGVLYYSLVYGRESVEYKKMLLYLKKFIYGGNERVEAVASLVPMSTLRRMIKTSPQLIMGASDEVDAYSGTVASVKEALVMKKKVTLDYVEKLVNATWYAITGENPSSQIVDKIVRSVIETGF